MHTETLRQAYRLTRPAKRNIERAAKEKSPDVQRGLLTLAADQIEKAMALIESAGKDTTGSAAPSQGRK